MYWGDYLGDTAHLTQGQHGAYLLLIAHYWRKGSLPASPEQCYSIAKALDEQGRSNVDAVLAEFFRREGDCYRHGRIDLELAKAAESHERRVLAGQKRWQNAKAMNEQCSSIAPSNAPALHEQPQPHPQPHPESKPRVKTKVTGNAFALPSWVPADAWQAFQEMRSRIRKPLTDRGRQLVVRELERLKAQGHGPGSVLEQSVLNGWSGVFPIKGRNDEGPVYPLASEERKRALARRSEPTGPTADEILRKQLGLSEERQLNGPSS